METLHGETGVHQSIALGQHPEERFSPQHTDNCLIQQLLNLSCLSKEPNLPHQQLQRLQIRAGAQLSAHGAPDLLPVIRSVWLHNVSFLRCNRITADFCVKVIFSWLSSRSSRLARNNECLSSGHASVVKDFMPSEGSMASYE